MTKIDVTMHSDQELSLVVFNDEYLYNQRRSRHFLRYIRESYIYTNDQFEVLKQDLKDDEAENDA